jgi:hypothetical protein
LALTDEYAQAQVLPFRPFEFLDAPQAALDGNRNAVMHYRIGTIGPRRAGLGHEVGEKV